MSDPIPMNDTNLQSAVENAKGTLEEMANRASVDMAIWDRHANAVLDLCARVVELEEANTRMREALEAVHAPYKTLTAEALEAGILMEFGPPKPDRGAAQLLVRAALNPELEGDKK